MVARQVLTLEIEVRILVGEPSLIKAPKQRWASCARLMLADSRFEVDPAWANVNRFGMEQRRS